MSKNGMARDDVFRALSDPTRRRILRLLNEGEMPAGEIAKRFEISAPSMSHHFSVLKNAGLIDARRSGQQINYSLNTTVMQDIVAMVMDIFRVEDKQPEETV